MKTKRTNLITFVRGAAYRVYRDVADGRLYYRENNMWVGTWPEYCREGKPSKVK